MHYKINEVARMLGITPQTLRFYEQYGIHVEKRVDDGYRQYSETSIDLLMSMRKHRNCGYTVAETAELLHSTDPEAIVASLAERAEGLRRQIELETRIADETERTLQKLRRLGEAPRRALRPPMAVRRFLESGKAEPPSKADMLLLGKWACHMPLLKWTQRFASWPEWSEPPERGFACSPDTADFLRLQDDAPLRLLPACPCLHALLRWNAENLREQVASVFALLDKKELAPGGDVMLCTLWNAQQEEKRLTYGELWIPITNL